MTKNEEFTEILGILKDVYGWNDTNELTGIQAELVNDVISVVKKLTIPDVSQQRELLLAFKKWEANKCKLPWDANIDEVVEQYIANNCG